MTLWWATAGVVRADRARPWEITKSIVEPPPSPWPVDLRLATKDSIFDDVVTPRRKFPDG